MSSIQTVVSVVPRKILLPPSCFEKGLSKVQQAALVKRYMETSYPDVDIYTVEYMSGSHFAICEKWSKLSDQEVRKREKSE